MAAARGGWAAYEAVPVGIDIVGLVHGCGDEDGGGELIGERMEARKERQRRVGRV